MYYEFFGFNQPPFRITPDTNLFYPGGNRGAVLDALVYSILNGEGIVKVVGEVGSGKTMLCRMLEKELPDNVEVVYLVNPSISPENTLHAIAFELKLNVKPNTSRFEVMNALQEYLLKRHSENQQVVVFVEEAQSMPIATLEEIRLLSNLETQQSKLLQIALFGQPELDEMIARPEIRQLKERITYSFDLTPFKTNDIREYLNTRVRACGYHAGDLFDDAAIKQIEQYSKGLLRRINILADKSLLAAYAENSKNVTQKHTRLAARDTEFVPKSRFPQKPVLVSAAVILLILIITGFYYLNTPRIVPANAINTQTKPDNSRKPEIQAPLQLPATESVPQPQALTIEQQDENREIVSDQSGQAVDITAVNSGAANSLQENKLQGVKAEEVAVIEQAGLPFVTLTQENSGNVEEEFPDDLSNAVDIGRESLTYQSSDATNEANDTVVINDQLLGLTPIFKLQEMGDSRLSAKESSALQQQISRLPPETVEVLQMSPESDICTQCWSIIYRPVWTSENL